MALIAIILATILDIPTLITIIGSMLVRSLKGALVVAITASILGLVAKGVLSMSPEPGILLITIPVQCLIAAFVFKRSVQKRSKKQQKQTSANEPLNEGAETIQSLEAQKDAG